MSHLPHPIFNDSLQPEPAKLSLQEAGQLSALCLLSLAFALAVTFGTGAKFVYGLPSVLLHQAAKRLSAS